MRMRVLELLEGRRPMTIKQIADEFDLPLRTVKSAIRAARNATPKQVYIADWFTPPVGDHGKQHGMYKLGDRKDVPMKIASAQDYGRRYRAKNHARILIKEEIRRRGATNPFTQLITQCRSAPKKQPSARA